MILFRPVGLNELLLIYKAGLTRFPPRLPEQPIFYPVLNQGYAVQIARDWNTKSGTFAGYVTEFDVDDAYIRALPVQQVGAREHRELWVPAEALDEFNDHIQNRIRVVAAYFAPTFVGLVPTASSLRGKNAREQAEVLWGIYTYSLMDFHGEITANHEAVFAHYPFWEHILAAKSAAPAIDGEVLLPAIRQAWSSAFPAIPLCVQPSQVTESSEGERH